MGRRKNNPELVDELIEGRWTMPQDEFEEKYFSLSASDRAVVDDVIDGMEDEFMNADEEDDDDEDSSERLSLSDAADIWLSNGCDEDYTFGYSENQLRKAAGIR